MTTVRAPGSSANLGPGFDVLGIAISRHVWVSDEPPPGRPDEDPCGPDHIARVAHRAAGGTGDVWCRFDLRPGRGMGFSAAARAAGALLAAHQQGLDPVDAARAGYRIVCDLEGHADNAAPSVFGGIQLVTEHRSTVAVAEGAGSTGRRWDPQRIGAALPGSLLLWVPDGESATDQSRAALPRRVPLSDAVFNIGRTALLLVALYEQRPDLMGAATDDRLHHRTRLAGLPGTAAARDRALDAGALACWLSGSGPALAVLVDPARADDIAAALPEDGAVLPLDIDPLGAVSMDDSRPPAPGD